MATNTKKANTKEKSAKVDFSKVSSSTKKVVFISNTDDKGLVKDAEYLVSENVADVLVLKGLGNKQTK